MGGKLIRKLVHLARPVVWMACDRRRHGKNMYMFHISDYTLDACFAAHTLTR